MGYYIQTSGLKNKAQEIVEVYGAEPIPQPASLAEVGDDYAVICVVQNPLFDAAGLCYSDDELKDFARPDSDYQRPRTWLKMEKAKAYELAGFRG